MLGTAGLAQAQDAAPSEGNEILVTARRTAERLQDVPVAVTAFGGAAALSGGNYNATMFVRGVGQNDFAIFSDPGVGF